MRIAQTIILLTLCGNAFAESAAQNEAPTSPCATAQVLNNQHQPVYFTQQAFEDGAQELAIVVQGVQKALVTKRITYQQQKTTACHFPAITIARGGDWGWFLAWADTEKLYYTRMDGEALVFVPPKKIPLSQVEKIEFLADSSQPTMRVQTQNGALHLLISDDEGRHWQLAPTK